MKQEKIIFVSSNEGKIKYLNDYLHIPVEYLKLDLPEIQSLDLHKIAADKAKRAYNKVKKPVFVEDVSLAFDALNGFPGPLIKWLYKTLGNNGLCSLLDNYENKNIKAEVVFAFCDEGGVRVFSGKTEGQIAKKPKGEAGFGWDSIFVPKGHKKTWAEMNEDEKHTSSMRKKALEKMEKFFVSHK